MKKFYFFAAMLFAFVVQAQAQQCSNCPGCPLGITYTATYTGADTCGMPQYLATAVVTITAPTGMMPDTVRTGWSSVPFIGQSTIIVTGGSNVVTYMWDFAAYIALPAVTFWASSNDADNGCVPAIICPGQDSSLPLNATLSTTSPQCGESTGQVSLSAIGGTAPYTYQWLIPTLPFPITNAATIWYAAQPGEYQVIVTDAHGCSTTVSGTVNNPPPPVAAEIIGIAATCEDANGTLTVNSLPTPYTTAAYTFAWSNGATTRTISGLLPGAYSVTVSNGLCDTVMNTVLINSGSPGLVTISAEACTFVVAPWGDTIDVSGSYVYVDSSNVVTACATTYIFDVTIQDVLIGDTTRVVTCGGYVQWLGGMYSQQGWYMQTDMSGDCPTTRWLEITVLDHTNAVVTHLSSCTPRADSIAPAMTLDGCWYSQVFVWDLEPSTTVQGTRETCIQGENPSYSQTTTADGCTVLTITVPIYVGSPDVFGFATTCQSEPTADITPMVNDHGCPYDSTTYYTPAQLPVVVHSVPSCDPDLIGWTILTDTISGACDTLVYTHYYEPAGNLAVLEVDVCAGELISLPDVPYSGIATVDTVVIVYPQGSCSLTWVLFINVADPGVVPTTEYTCDPFAVPYTVPGSNPCVPDTLVTPIIEYRTITTASLQDTCVAGVAPLPQTFTISGGCGDSTHITYYVHVANWEHADSVTCNPVFQDSVSLDTITVGGCTTIRRTAWWVRDIPTTRLSTRKYCPGTEFVWEVDGGNYIANDGTLFAILTSAEGCDSAVVMDVQLYDVENRDTTVHLCYRDSFKLYGIGIFGSAQWRDTSITSVNPVTGCIEYATIHLDVDMPDTVRNIEHRCDSLGWHQPVVVFYPLQGACGRIVTWEVEVRTIASPEVDIYQPECVGGEIIGGYLFLENAAAYDEFSWSTGSLTQGIVGLQSGQYYLSVSNGYCTDLVSYTMAQPECDGTDVGPCWVAVMPNPVGPGVDPVLEVANLGREVEVAVHSLDGTLHQEYEFTYSGGLQYFTLDGFPVTPGVYILHIKDNNGNRVDGKQVIRH